MTLPYTFQLKDVRQIARMNGRALVAWCPGLGKSFCALFYLHRNPEALPAVVVCPASLKYQWAHQSMLHFGFRADVLGGTKPTPFGMAGCAPLLIVNYDVLAPSRNGPGWTDALRATGIKTVIIDECQNLGDMRTHRTRAVRRLCKGIPHVLALSGTPLTNRPAELFPTLNILRPDLFPAFQSFARFCAPHRAPWGMEYKGASNLPELHAILTNPKDPVMIRRRKIDVIDELPDKIRTGVPLELSNRREYEHARDDFMDWLTKAAPGRLSGALRAQALVKAGYLKRLTAEGKMKSAIEWVDNWLSGCDEKIILFCYHKMVVERLRKHYLGKCVVVDGSVTGRHRQDAVDQFQRNPTVRIFIGNMKAAGAGLNLTAAGATAFLEYGWKPADHTQAESRGYARLGDMHGMRVYYIYARDTVEQRVAQVIQGKQGVINAVLDGDAGDGDTLDLFDMVVGEMRKTVKVKS